MSNLERTIKDLVIFYIKENLSKDSYSEYFFYVLISCELYNKENKKL